MDSEETKLLRKLSDTINSIIDKFFDKYGMDRAYYEFTLLIDILDDRFQPYERIILLQDKRLSRCLFCNKETYFYDDELEAYLCFEHFLEKWKKTK